MLAVIVSLLMVLLSLLAIGAIGWHFGTKRGYAKAQDVCRKLLQAEQLARDEEIQRLRESAAQEIQSLNRERERLLDELAHFRMDAMERSKHGRNVV